MAEVSTINTMLTDRQVAALFGCSRATVWLNVKKGILPNPLKFGGITRFHMAEVLEVIDAAKQRRRDEKGLLNG